MATLTQKTTCVALVLLANAALLSSAAPALGIDQMPDDDDDFLDDGDDDVTPIVEPSVSDDAAVSGTWSEAYEVPVIPVAAALMPSGKVLLWSAYSKDNYELPEDYPGEHPGQTATAIFDPEKLTVEAHLVASTQHDMFCPGITVAANGDIIVTGGKSAEKTSIFDPVLEKWLPGPDMKIARGYQSSVMLDSGEIFVLGGSWSGEDIDDEKYGPRGGEVTVTDPATGTMTWKELPGIPADPLYTQDLEGPYRADNHAMLFGWSNGLVFHAGPSVAMHFFDTAGQGSVQPAGSRPGQDAMCGSAVMFDAGRILVAGGANSYVKTPGLTDATLITLSGSQAQTKVLPPMKQGRSFASPIAMPDGKVLIVGGMTTPLLFDDTGAFLEPEMWDPVTEEFTLMAPMSVPRTYHSVAILLKDGRVLAGGGGLCGPCKGDYNVNHLDVEIYTPPYLYAANGELAPRPTITLPRDKAKNGAVLKVSSSEPLDMISMVRFGSATHAVNTDQRRIELCGPAAEPCKAGGAGGAGGSTGLGAGGSGPVITGTSAKQTKAGGAGAGGSSSYTITIPEDAGVASKGYWLIFGFNKAGVPSEGEVLLVQ